MGHGRTPCCEKIGLKKGPWTQAEDMRLRAYIKKYGHLNWRVLPKRAGLLRCGKSCRLRWTNYLRPDIKRGNFTPDEEDAIIKLHKMLGNKWSTIASHLPGRTDNEIKNVWNTRLKKLLLVSKETNFIDEPSESSCSSSSSSILLYNHSEETGYPDQVHEKSESGSHPEIYNTMPTENMLYPFEEILEIPVEPHLNLWDMLGEDSSLLLERNKDEIANSENEHISDQLVQQDTNPSIDEPKESSIEERSLSSDGSKTPREAHDMMHWEKEQGHLEMPEFPIDPDFGFWDILDVESYLLSSLPIDEHDESLKNTTLQEDTKRETEEIKKWITDLEEELNFWATSDQTSNTHLSH